MVWCYLSVSRFLLSLLPLPSWLQHLRLLPCLKCFLLSVWLSLLYPLIATFISFSALFLPLGVMKKCSLGISVTCQMHMHKGKARQRCQPVLRAVRVCVHASRALHWSTSEHLAYVPMIGWGSSSGYNTWKCLGMLTTTAAQFVHCVRDDCILCVWMCSYEWLYYMCQKTIMFECV